jgi:hypothetical protein
VDSLHFAVFLNFPGGQFTNIKQLFLLAVFQRSCQQAAYAVNTLPADFLAIVTQRLVNAKYRAVKSCLVSTQHIGELEQDFTA